MSAAARAAAKRSDRVRPGPGGSALLDTPRGPAPRRLEAPDDASQARRDENQHVGPVVLAEEAAALLPERRRRRRRARLCALLAALVALGLTAVAVLGWEYAEGRRTDAARTQAVAAARKAAPVVLSYDHRRLEADFAAARGHLTGAFKEEYGRTTSKVVGPTAKKYRGVVKASVVAPPDGGTPAASVVSVSPDRAVVLLFVNQVTTSTQVTGSRVDLNRVRMTMTRTSGGWKVSAVDAL
jgi:Mce-associated membrane protein